MPPACRLQVMVRSRRLELPRPFGHSDLNAARLPVPPRPHVMKMGRRCSDRQPGGRASSKGYWQTQRRFGVLLWHIGLRVPLPLPRRAFSCDDAVDCPRSRSRRNRSSRRAAARAAAPGARNGAHRQGGDDPPSQSTRDRCRRRDHPGKPLTRPRSWRQTRQAAGILLKSQAFGWPSVIVSSSPPAGTSSSVLLKLMLLPGARLGAGGGIVQL